MLLQSAAIVAMLLLNELLVVDKIAACVRQICLVAVICKVSKRKTLSGETFCFDKLGYQYFNFGLQVTLFAIYP